LLAGDGEFAGRNGYAPYFRRLTSAKDSYEAINDQLRQDWRERRTGLLKVALAAALTSAGVPLPGAVVGAGLAAAGGSALKETLARMSRLALFYQETRGLKTPPHCQ
jgi:hypothetical protein